MQLRLHRPRSRGDADLKGAPRVSFKSTWRYSYSLSTTTSTTTPTPLHQKFTTTPTYLHNGIHTGPLTFLLLRQSSNQPGKKPHSVFVCSLILFFFSLLGVDSIVHCLDKEARVRVCRRVRTNHGRFFGFLLFLFILWSCLVVTYNLWPDIDAIWIDLAILSFFLILPMCSMFSCFFLSHYSNLVFNRFLFSSWGSAPIVICRFFIVTNRISTHPAKTTPPHLRRVTANRIRMIQR